MGRSLLQPCRITSGCLLSKDRAMVLARKEPLFATCDLEESYMIIEDDPSLNGDISGHSLKRKRSYMDDNISATQPKRIKITDMNPNLPISLLERESPLDYDHIMSDAREEIDNEVIETPVDADHQLTAADVDARDIAAAFRWKLHISLPETPFDHEDQLTATDVEVRDIVADFASKLHISLPDSESMLRDFHHHIISRWMTIISSCKKRCSFRTMHEDLGILLEECKTIEDKIARTLSLFLEGTDPLQGQD